MLQAVASKLTHENKMFITIWMHESRCLHAMVPLMDINMCFMCIICSIHIHFCKGITTEFLHSGRVGQYFNIIATVQY